MEKKLNKEIILKKYRYAFEKFYKENSYLLKNQDYKPGKKVYRNMTSINKIMNLFIESDKEYLDKDYIIEKYSWDGSSTYVQHERVITNFNLSEISWKERSRPCIILNSTGRKLLERYKEYLRNNSNVDLMGETNYVIPDFTINYIIKCLKETTIEDMSLWKNCLMSTLYLGIELGFIPKYKIVNKNRAIANEKEKLAIKKCCGYENENGDIMDLTYFEQVIAMLLDLNLIQREVRADLEESRIAKYYLNEKAYKLLEKLSILKKYDKLEAEENLEKESVVEGEEWIQNLGKNIVEVELPLRSEKNETKKEKINKGKKRNYEKENKKKIDIGKKGELLILEYERKRLEKYGVKNIEDKLIWVSEEYGDGLGYDILSYDIENNSEIYIEVKATEKERDEKFFITDSELRFSKEKSNQYYLYRLYGVNNKNNEIKFYKVNGDVEKYFYLEPIKYLAKR